MKSERRGSLMVTPTSIRRLSDQDVKQFSDVERVKKIVLILLAVKLTLTSFYFMGKLYDFIDYTGMPKSLRKETISWKLIAGTIGAVVLLIYLISFIIIVNNLFRRGILLFAWLAIIELALVILMAVFMIIKITIQRSSAAPARNAGLFSIVVLVIAVAISLLLTILTIIYSVKLAKLIKQQEEGEYQSV